MTIEQNFYGDYFLKLLKDLYTKTNTPVPEYEFNTLQQLVDEARARDDVLKSWGRVQDDKIGARSLDLPFYPIYSEVLVADTASIAIPIPGWYKHLMIMGQGRVNGSGGQTVVTVFGRYNEDSGNNYQWGSMTQTGTSLAGVEDLSDPYNIFFAFTADGEGTGGFAGASIVFIPHYQSSFYKMQLSFRGNSLTASTSNSLRHSLWRNTSAITSITFLPDPAFSSAKIQAGSLISVYGLT